ncbi:exonuclease domain-containing protein [Aegicerativicinus sediminis]
MIYTVIDVETTGRTNKLTEISIFKIEDGEVVNEFTSLINPQIHIPDYITALTGIDNTMVADAPTFEEISTNIIEITEGAIFVAHNVNFDYNAIRNEFKEIGVDFRRKKLCTVRLSRTIYPTLRSYSLGKLCHSLGITITDRHRARGDAQATTVLFKRLLNEEGADKVFKEFLKKSSKESTLPTYLPAQVFNRIPEKVGIYYFKDKKGKIIYVGKAKNLRNRVLGHFYDKSTNEIQLCRETADIDFNCSGSELIALLMEDAAIKHHFPKYNKASKRPVQSYSIVTYEDRKGILHLAFTKLRHKNESELEFYSMADCRLFLEQLCEEFQLCPKYCHLQEGVDHCNHYKIKDCKGICRGKEEVESYNQRALNALNVAKKRSDNIILKFKGRNKEEEAFVWMKNGRYLGYGFINKDFQINREDELESYLIPQKDNNDIRRILRKSILTHKATVIQNS